MRTPHPFGLLTVLPALAIMSVLGTYGLTINVSAQRVTNDPGTDRKPARPDTLETPSPKTPSPKTPSLKTPSLKDIGHLVLQVEGNIHELAVTWITPKTSGLNPPRLQSPFSIDLLDGAGTRLGTYPLDLSTFDLDPARVGQPVRVEGCRVWDSRIATLANVPYRPGTASLQIRSGRKVIGRLDAARMASLITKGSIR